jgi:hypothetical protein
MKQNIEQKIKQLLDGGAKIINVNPSIKPFPNIDEYSCKNSPIYLREHLGTFSNLKLTQSSIRSMTQYASLINESMRAQNSMFYDGKYPFTPFTTFNIDRSGPSVRQTLIQRPLPGRNQCNLTALFYTHTFKVEVGIYPDMRSYHKIGNIGSGGFESDKTYVVTPHGDLLKGSDLLSASVMFHSDIVKTEGPNWEDIRDDQFWSTFEQDAIELSQVASVIES